MMVIKPPRDSIMPSVLLVFPILCGTLCLILKRQHSWYWLGWLPLCVGSLLSGLFCLAGLGSAVGNGPEAGFAALGRAYAVFMMLPGTLLAPVLWFLRPKSELSTGALLCAIGCLSFTGVLLHLETTQPVMIQLVQADGKPASKVRVSTSDGPMRLSDAKGEVHFRVKSPHGIELMIPAHNLRMNFLPRNRAGIPDLWFCRWDHLSGQYATELEDQQPLVVYLPSQNHLLAPALSRQIKTWLTEAQEARRMHLPNFGGCPESLEFVAVLRDLVATHPVLHEDLRKILLTQAALLSQMQKTVERHREKAASAPALQPLLAWVAKGSLPGTVTQLEVRLDELSQQVLEMSVPLLKSQSAWVLQDSLGSLKWSWQQLAPLLQQRSLDEVAIILEGVSNWRSPADAAEALSLIRHLEATDTRTATTEKPHPSPRLKRLKERLLRASR